MSKGFSLKSDNGTRIEFTKLNPKSKSYDMLIKTDTDEYWHKVGIIKNIDKLRRAFNFD